MDARDNRSECVTNCNELQVMHKTDRNNERRVTVS